MSEMRTQTTKGRKARRIAAIALIFVLLLGVMAAVSASAASGLFKIVVYDNTTTDENGNLSGAVQKSDKSAVDGASNFSKSATVNLKTDGIFTVEDYADLSQVRRLEFTVSDRSTNVTVNVTTSAGSWQEVKSSGWGSLFGSSTKSYYYQNESGVDKATFDSLMNAISVTCKSSSSTTTASSVKLTLQGGNSAKTSIGSSNRLGLEDGKGTTYTEVLTFFTYATAQVDLDSVQVQFKNDSGDATNETPKTEKNGSATFDMLVTNVGDGSFLRLGYQIKKATQTWDTSTSKMYEINESTYRYDRTKSTGKNATDYPLFSELGTVNSTTGVVTNPQPVTITVEGLDPEVDYDIRGVVVTNSDSAAYTKAVNVPRVKYTQPVIATLNIGNTSAQQGGVEKEISSTIEFNNRNYDKLSDGPRLKMQLYFTQNLVIEGGVDRSDWGRPLVEQTKALEQNEDGTYKSNLTFDYTHTLPHADAPKCAYKLVVTDVNANSEDGYFVKKYSEDTFVLDENPPTAPIITSGSGSGIDLSDGSAAVGGANSRVDMIISGSTDEGSGVKEYSYEMYYLESDQVDNFIIERSDLNSDATNQQVLQAMATLSGAGASKVCEYTPSTSLVLQEDGSSTLGISKDGFYAIKATAIDNVGKTSDPTVAIFRVDLTPPKAPVIALAAQVNTDERIANSGSTPIASSKFRAYDNRTYTSDTVWVFVRSEAQIGKVVDPAKYQFSINGGLVWRSIDSAVNFNKAKAYTTSGGTVSIYKSDFSATETFTYDAAFQLSCDDISGYQTVVVRAVDSLGNTSQPSSGVNMRTTEIIHPVGTIQHEGIEIAMAMGNTSLETTASLVQDLRNDVALKINEKYWGTNHAYNQFNSNKNPISLLYTSANNIHQCTFDSNGNNNCPASCPYKTYAEQYNLYTPSMANMQDLASGDKQADTNFDWVRFDHTNIISETVAGKGTVYYPTVVFDGGTTTGSAGEVLHTTADTNIDPTKSTYLTTSGATRYTAMSDYVVYTGQSVKITNATKAAGEANRLANVQKLNSSNTYAMDTSTNMYHLTGRQSHAWATQLGSDTYTAMGRYQTGLGDNRPKTSAVQQRVYHLLDWSTTKSTSYGSYSFQTTSLADQGKWEKIYMLGYYYTSSKDWLFVYNGQSTRKEIYFTVDDTQLVAHSNDGYGFWFNTTIRQNVAGEWVISGYIFALGTEEQDSSITVDGKPYYRYIFQLQDVRLDWWANSRLKTAGTYFNNISTNTDPSLDDFFRWVRAEVVAAGGTMTYGTQKITLLAYSDSGEGVTQAVRNYVLVTDGASAEAYYWQASGKTSTQCVEQFDRQKDVLMNLDTNTDKTTGYTKIHWYKYDKVTKYSNTNPSASAKGKGTDHVLYVPRPVVDGSYNVGDLSIFEDTDDPSTYPHSDSNCYGFGPISFARSTGHGCNNDTLIIFSNVTMRVTKGKSLADVITQPQWGTGKVKYILNVSDDSIADLTDPIMSATVAWRIQNDSAKFISWGSLINRKTTKNFIDTKIQGNGTYVVSRVTGYDDQTVRSTSLNKNVTAPGQRSQSKQVAEYIANTYYKSYGIDTTASGTKAPDAVSAMLSSKGSVVSMENAKLLNFSVTPENYNDGTANEDFPSGRWYITYDATGYAGRSSYARFSDALDLTLNKPGRYQVYFAPDMSLLGANLKDPLDDKLDPNESNCIFDLIVNEEAYAQPIATVDTSNKITVNDFSIDPDNNILIDEYTDAENKKLLYSSDGTLLTGIQKTYWRWELTAPYTDPVSKEQQSIVLMKSGVTTATRSANGTITSPYNGLTVAQLTQQVGKLYTETGYNAQTYIDKLKAAGDTSLNYLTTGTTVYYDKVPKGATIIIYEQVEDVSTRRTLSNGQTKYVVSGTTKSPEATTNLVAATDTANARPIRPASSLTLSTETMYDTASSSDYITVTRSSFHGQKQPLTLGWQLNVSGYTAPVPLSSSDSGNTWKTPVNGTVLDSKTGEKWQGGQFNVLESVTPPSFNATTGRTGGVWKISKATIQNLAKSVGGSFALKIVEQVTSSIDHGAWADGSSGTVDDSSSRAIYYSRDQRAPTMQTVSLQTGTLTAIDAEGNETWEWADYEASNYLDMTVAPGQVGAKKIKVTVSGSSDNEGSVSGYAYCYYIGSNQSTATYYYMNANGTLQSAGTGAAGAKAAINLSSGRGILQHSDKHAVHEDDEFSFEIDANAMTLNGVPQAPLVSLNLAVCAFDNQTGVTTGSTGALTNVTGANETVRTKVENIKLAKFVPTVVSITAVNTTGETISTIGNDHALAGDGVDEVVTSIPVTNTKVSVSFIPRQDWFEISNGTTAYDSPRRVTNQATIDQLESRGDTTGRYIKYFTDRTGAADLTNRVTIDYEIERREQGGNVYEPYGSGKDLAYTSTISIDKSGDYRVTAKAKNGSGVYSAPQTLTFSVDREPPAPAPTVTVYDSTSRQPYKEGEWVKGVVVSVSDSRDADTQAYYMYSTDNGVHWQSTKTSTHLNDFEFTINETNTHYLRVKAVDTGGNETEAAVRKIMVDNTPPKVSPPNVSVNSSSVTVFTECVVTIGQTAGGVVYALNDDGTANTVDQDVIVEPGEGAKFVIIPDEGKRVLAIKLNDTAYSVDELVEHDAIEGGLVLTIPQINGDATLQVTFVDEAQGANYMAAARAASFNALQALRVAAPEVYANEDAPRVIALGHYLEIEDSDFDATTTTSDADDPTNVENGTNVVLNIAVTEGYRVTQLRVRRYDSTAGTVTVPASELTKVNKNLYTYVLENVTSDVTVYVDSEKKTPATVTLDVDGNGSITVDDEVTVRNETYSYASYEDDAIVLKVSADRATSAAGYKLSSLKINGVEQVTGTALDTYDATVTKDMTITAEFVMDSDDPYDQLTSVTVRLNKTNGELHGTVSPRGTVSQDEATGAEVHVIPVLYDTDQVILLKPNPTYTPIVTYAVNGEMQILGENDFKLNSATGYYELTLKGVKDEYNIVNVEFTGKKHKITGTTIAQEIGQDDVEGAGGSITYTVEGTTDSDLPLTEVSIPEGSNVSIKITPDSGYRLEKVLLNGKDMGKRRNLSLNYLNEETQITATFSKRGFGEAKTSHSLSATAVGISDGQQALHDEAYSFKLNDRAWSAFQSGTSISYAELDPNTKYTVTVRAQDKLNNISSEETLEGTNATTIHTLANVPAALDVEEADDTDNVMDKSVKITVDAMGNPDGTKYAVYYSERSDMRNRQFAAVNQNGDLWSELDGFGQITAYHLTPGTRYYLQVIAQNEDGVSTEANDQNVLEITLSPTAPPDNTLYFEEQTAPGEPIKLHWDDPAGEVLGFVIFRDGTLIGEVGKDYNDYTDSYDNLRGDGAYVYSYAYKNEAGVGARRTAVSEEYYRVAKAAEGKPESSSERAALKKLDDLKTVNQTTYANLYKEVMTYPTFPTQFTKVYAMPLGVTTYNGEIVLRVQPDSSTTARAQRYLVGLHAYEKQPDGSYRKVSDGETYGDTTNRLTWNSASTEKYTASTGASGASVSWNGLNINWEYRVYVKEVTSTGWAKYDDNGNLIDGYYNGSPISPETALHKQYTVNYKGYGYTYVAPTGALDAGLKTVTTVPWTNDTANAYTKRANDTYTGWNLGNGDGIELVSSSVLESDDYIKFNKSAQIYIPKNGNAYDLNYLYGTASGDNTELTAYGNRYLVVEQGDEGMTVKLHVKVYDPDGPADGNLNYTVTGVLGGVTARTTLAPAAADVSAVGTDEATATECVLTFDFKNLATGVYNDLKLSVANGAIDVAYEDPDTIAANNVISKAVSLVVNQSLPTISASNGGATKKVEDGRNYGTTSKLTVSTNVSANNQVNLRKVRMILMEKQYTAAGLQGQFNAVMAGTGYNEAQIDAVQPPKTVYFQVSEETYLAEQAKAPDKVMKTEPTAGIVYYWLEKEYALQNNLASFLHREANGNMVVRKPASDPYGTTYPLLIVANFGKNQSTMNLRFQVMEAPSLTVETEQTWAWVETTKKEYEAYERKASDSSKDTWTIGDVYQEAVDHDALNEDTQTPAQMGFDHSEPAMQVTESSGESTYMVFKLWDNKATIQSKQISSYIQVKTGMYSQIEDARVVMVPEVDTDPSDGNVNAPPPASDSKPTGYTGSHTIKIGQARYQGYTQLSNNVRANFTVSNLDASTTYHMWVYYKVIDPESGAEVWYHTPNSLAMTTDDDYLVSTVGFSEAGRSYKESAYDATGRIETATLSRLGDFSYSSVKLHFTMEYYEADQYGEYVLDEATGQPKQIMPGTAQYQMAANTVSLITEDVEILEGYNQAGVEYRIRNTDEMQGHMIVRLIETITANGGTGGGINRVTTNADTFEVFVLDDESPITSYKAGLDDAEGVTFVETSDSHLVGKHYDYKFNGLPDPYGSADTSSLSLLIKNIGEGELNNITATLYAADRRTLSNEFVFATPPTLTSLASPQEGVLAASERSLLKIVPAENLEDGVHEGWLKITADLVEDEDVIWVHLYQVVGQATLKGNIYISEAKPETTTEHVGVATVKIYASTASTGANRGEPLYETQTNDNGYFEIPNILVLPANNYYCIVVDRIGCSTYDGLYNGWRWRPTESVAYRFDLQMVAGDINNDGQVNGTDRLRLEASMNHTIQEALDLREAALKAGDEELAEKYAELAEEIRRCDLDQNGGVNAIDRMLLWQNLNKGTTTGGITVPLYRAVTPTKITE